MSGKTSIRRLDFGVTRDDGRSMTKLGPKTVGVSFALRLTPRIPLNAIRQESAHGGAGSCGRRAVNRAPQQVHIRGRE